MNTSLKKMVLLAALVLPMFTSAQNAKTAKTDQEQGQIYKQVDAQGNVTYTDQKPPDGSAPMVLPKLSVIHMDTPPEVPAVTGEKAAAESTAKSGFTPRQLRKMYRDFHITRPTQEETFWGTANMVVISWGSSTELQKGMIVKLFVDGKQQPTTGDNMVALKLDRGEHKVYAQLQDARGRNIVATDIVTFYVKQYSANFKQSNTATNKGN